MLRTRLALLVAAGTFLLTGCGTTQWIDSSNGTHDPVVTVGWTKVHPIVITLPTDHPVGTAGSAPDLAGPLVVNIWASYCAPCKAELPLLQRISTAGRIAVVGFTRDTDASKAEAELTGAGVTYPNWTDTDAKIALALDGRVPINAVPSSVLIRGGKVVAVHIGEFKNEDDVLKGLELQ
ncbi:MAG: TlpA family protein disulfide reductase [Marmoricola sp.]